MTPPSGRTDSALDPRIAEALRRLWDRRTVPRVDGEGLRDRKKRLLRQQISDTATLMFLQRGFDEVRVAEIAEECGVSEKTVYNYFPTKESLLFDREDDLADRLADAFGEGSGTESLTEIALALVDEQIEEMFEIWTTAPAADDLIAMRQFGELIDRTPALQAAWHGMIERLTQVIAEALARRARVAPDDPEPQMAAQMLMGIWRAQHTSLHRHVGLMSPTQLRDRVRSDVRRAARVADAGLGTFDAVARSGATKQQIHDAALAADEARRQVVAAVKQARAAWKQVAEEARSRHGDDVAEEVRRQQRRARQEFREALDAQRRELREQLAAAQSSAGTGSPRRRP